MKKKTCDNRKLNRRYLGVGIKMCPFCGATPLVKETMWGHAFTIGCNNPECYVQPTTKYFGTLEEALTVWRKRAKNQ